MSEKFCPAGKIECERSVIEHFCGIKSIWRVEDNTECPFPDCQHLNAGDVESVAAEIADMPEAEFQANCEKLKKLSKIEFENEQFLKGYKQGAEDMKPLLGKCHLIFAKHAFEVGEIPTKILIDIMTELEATIEKVEVKNEH